MRRVTTSDWRAEPAGTVLDHIGPTPVAELTDRVTASPVMSASSRAALASSSKPMAIHATGSGLRTDTVDHLVDAAVIDHHAGGAVARRAASLLGRQRKRRARLDVRAGGGDDIAVRAR